MRQRLIVENRMSRYLFYASGEIILVVAGIVIALQVNNWNHQRLDKIREAQFLRSIATDLSEQVVDLEEYILSEKFYTDNGDYLLEIMSGSDHFEVNDDFLIKLNALVVRKTFNPIITTFEELKASGNIGLIRDQDLKKGIIKFYNELDRKARVINNNNLHVIDGICQPAILDHSMMFKRNHQTIALRVNERTHEGRGVDKMKERAMDNLSKPDVARKMFNIVEQRTLIARLHHDYYIQLKGEIAELVDLINTYIN